MAKESAAKPAPLVTLHGIVSVGDGLYRLVSRKVPADSVTYESEADTHQCQLGRLVGMVKR